ncbi:MAG: VOC family protein [Acidimicrobiales bacterium]
MSTAETPGPDLPLHPTAPAAPAAGVEVHAGSTASAPDLLGVHHLRLPVIEVERSRDWYVQVLGFETILDYEEEDHVAGVLLRHASGIVLGLHEIPGEASMLAGFTIAALAVGNRADLDKWAAWLDEIGMAHGPVTDGHLGWFITVTDPDGIVIELHTLDQPSVGDARRP